MLPSGGFNCLKSYLFIKSYHAEVVGVHMHLLINNSYSIGFSGSFHTAAYCFMLMACAWLCGMNVSDAMKTERDMNKLAYKNLCK